MFSMHIADGKERYEFMSILFFKNLLKQHLDHVKSTFNSK